jgi:hypothetical protein
LRGNSICRIEIDGIIGDATCNSVFGLRFKSRRPMVILTTKSLAQGARVGSRLIASLRKIPGIEVTLRYVEHSWFNPIATKLITHADDADLSSALDLYKRRIPDDQRFESADIIGWISEDLVARRNLSPGAPTDWFVVAIYKRRVCGFVLFHFYPKAHMAFFAYMVVAQTPGIPVDLVSNTLCARVVLLLRRRRELRGCKTIVMEVENPSKQTSERMGDESLARVRRFCSLAQMRGFSLRAFDFDYKQPKLSTDDPEGSEHQLLLLSAKMVPSLEPSADQLSTEVAELVSFIYTSIYPEGYSADPEETRLYRRYCERLRNQELARLPANIRTLGLKQLVAQVRRGKISPPRKG